MKKLPPQPHTCRRYRFATLLAGWLAQLTRSLSLFLSHWNVLQLALGSRLVRIEWFCVRVAVQRVRVGQQRRKINALKVVE